MPCTVFVQGMFILYVIIYLGSHIWGFMLALYNRCFFDMQNSFGYWYVICIEGMNAVYRVLIVDDNSYPPEFRIYEAGNGFQAWELLQDKELDMVFTDVRMRVMDGIELLKPIKSFDKNIQTIIFSAYSDFKYTGKVIENNVDAKKSTIFRL